MVNAVARYKHDWERAVEINTDFKNLFLEFRDALEQNAGGLEFFYKHVGNVWALVIGHFDRDSRVQISLVIPIKLDDLDHPDPVVTNFYSSTINGGAVGDGLSPGLQAEMVSAFDQQISEHTTILLRLPSMPQAERFSAW